MEKLITQTTGDLFTYSVVVADNDPGRSAEPVVAKFSATAPMRITYCVEPQQNIALVRNRALQHADGDLIAFIDDDEFPVDNWLLSLVSAYKQYGVDGVLGPVKPYFEHEPPQWVRKGGFFERPNHATGYKLSWAECRTGNLLFRKSILDGIDTPFRPAFGTGGEDVDFFRRVIDMQFVFIWCRDAIAYELVPPARCTRSFLLRRALLRGSNSSKYTAGRLRNFLKSVIAVPCYSLALPVLAVCGHHVFLKYLVKLCDHASRLLAFAGWSVVKERQT